MDLCPCTIIKYFRVPNWSSTGLRVIVQLPFPHNEMIPSSFRLPNWTSTGKSVKHPVYAEILLNIMNTKNIVY